MADYKQGPKFFLNIDSKTVHEITRIRKRIQKLQRLIKGMKP